MTISVIIPVFNEQTILPTLLHQIKNWPIPEIIIVDGNSNDQTQAIVKRASSCRLLVVKKGRGHQMNEGARVATSDILLFLHADSVFPSDGFSAISKALEDTNLVGGAFRLKIDAHSLCLKLVVLMANLRSSLFGLPYGDQGFFVRRNIFNTMNGYQDIPLMEDVEFIQRLKRKGKIILLTQTIMTSTRKWSLFISLRNIILLTLYCIGVSEEQLAKWYN